MGARWATQVACAACLCAGAAPAAASVIVEPIARLSLEGGYDSNAFYDGHSGYPMGMVSPDLGLRLSDHTWNARASYGGDFLNYGMVSPLRAWNQRGDLRLELHPDRRTAFVADGSGQYAIDPVGLARLGIFGRAIGPALLVSGGARASWMASPRLQLAATYQDREARFNDGGGGAMHAPGAEVAWHLDARTQIGGAYRFDVFQDFRATATGLAFAHELKALARHHLARDLELDAEAGPAWWMHGADRYLVPEASVTLIGTYRYTDVRASLRHGVGLGGIANPVLSDGLEVGVSHHLSRWWRVHADGGLWRSGAVSGGGASIVAYSAGGEIAWRMVSDAEIGLAASQFARLDDPSPSLRRTIFGLRISWLLESRFDPHP